MTEQEQQLSKFPFIVQGVVAAYLCERMLPNYVQFAEQLQAGEPSVLRGLLNTVWEKLATGKLTAGKSSQWERWQEKLEAATPNEIEHDVLGVYPAIAACTALSCLVQGITEQDAICFQDVAEISLGSIAHYLELGECAGIASAELRATTIEQHELVQYEIAVQEAMLLFLAATSSVTPALVREVRHIARAEGHSNLGLPA